ncbi:hypothetical protein D3C87_1952710 [compost metagenome]
MSAVLATVSVRPARWPGCKMRLGMGWERRADADRITAPVVVWSGTIRESAATSVCRIGLAQPARAEASRPATNSARNNRK